MTIYGGDLQLQAANGQASFSRGTLSTKTLRTVTDNSFTRNDFAACAMAIVDYLTWALLFYIASAGFPLAVRGIAACAESIFMARLFIIGHDVCHGSILGGKRLRSVIGRLLFLPTLTPFSTWRIGHNSAHHGYSNLKGRDHVWTPMTLLEFRTSTLRRQLLERLYRSCLGQGIYYLVGLWWNELYFPKWARSSRRYTTDSLLVTLGGLGGAVVSYGTGAGSFRMTQASVNGFESIILACIVPFLLWNQLMGLVIYLQHTHPQTRWFADRKEWSFEKGQIESTVHASLPLGLHHLLHNILEHTAHHVDVTIPYYGLKKTQLKLEAVLGDCIIRQQWNWKQFVKTTKVCKLFDYREGVWTDFEGRPSVLEKMGK